MANHQDAPLFAGQFDECPAVSYSQGKRLFDKNIFTGVQGIPDHGGVKFGRCRDDKAANLILTEQVGEIGGEVDTRILAYDGFKTLWIAIANCGQHPKFMPDANVVSTPGARADDCDVRDW